MKKTTRTKKLVADTVSKLKEAQTATQEKVAALAAMRISYAKTTETQAEAVTRYLDHAASDAMKRSENILPTVADVKAHPLPAWQDLTATPVSKRTLAAVTDEITDYLKDEYQSAAPGMMHGLEDFLTWYQGTFLEALRRLTEQKIATAETLGKTGVKKKLVEAFAALPSFPSPEAFDDYCQRILKRNAADPTDEIVRQWREGKQSPFPAPDAFKTAFRRALMLDAEATAEINGDGHTAASIPEKKTERQDIISLVYEIYTSKDWKRRKIKGDKTPKDISYPRAIRIMLDEPLPTTDPFYYRANEARKIVKKLSKGRDDTKIRNSLRTEVINYAKNIQPASEKTPTIKQAISHLSQSNKMTVRDALDRHGEDYYDGDGYIGKFPTIGDASAHR